MKKLYQNKYRVDSTRLKDWDYGSKGQYFVTICTKNRIPYFGELHSKGNLVHSIIGDYAIQCYYTIPTFHPFALIDEFIIMPDHIHALLLFNSQDKPIKENNKFGPHSKNLASVIRGFKSGISCFAKKHKIDFKWQPRFYDRIVHNEIELNNVRKYIINNPMKHATS